MSRKFRAIVLLVALAIGTVVMVAACGSSSSSHAAGFYNDPHATPTTLGSVNLPVAPRNEPINSRVPTWPWE